MTAEIWTMVIIAIIQIIVMCLIGYWQVRTMKQIENPSRKAERAINKFFGKFLKYRKHKSSILLIFIPFYLYMIYKVAVSTVSQDIKITAYTLAVFLICGTAAISTLLSIIESLIITSKCHMARLDKFADRPCKEGSCPF